MIIAGMLQKMSRRKSAKRVHIIWESENLGGNKNGKL
jgi:hypothetical protein